MTAANPAPRKRRLSFGVLLSTLFAPAFGWMYAGGWGAIIVCAAWMVCVTLPRTTGIRLLGFLKGFYSPENLPLTMVNITLAILVGSLAFGIDVAFYAALVGVPIVVLTLTVVALEPGETPAE